MLPTLTDGTGDAPHPQRGAQDDDQPTDDKKPDVTTD